MRSNKICFVIPTLRIGGAERVISVLANEFETYPSTNVSILLLVNTHVDYFINSNVEIITPKFSYNSNFWSKTLYKIRILIYIRKTVKRINPNAVLSFMAKYNNLVLIALLGTNIKRFVSDRSNPHRKIGHISNFFRHLLYRTATGIVAQTKKAADIIRKQNLNNNIKVIHNPLRELKIIPRTDFSKNIINIGRNVPEKNQERLIEMFSKMNNKGWKLIIIGSGPLHQRLKNKIQELFLDDKVILKKETSEIDYYFCNADIFAFVSLFEGFPNSLSEALGHGLTCLSFNCPTGPDELIQNDKNGILVDLNDEEAFISQCNALMQSEILRKRLTSNAILSSKKYSAKQIAQKYFDFLLEEY